MLEAKNDGGINYPLGYYIESVGFGGFIKDGEELEGIHDPKVLRIQVGVGCGRPLNYSVFPVELEWPPLAAYCLVKDKRDLFKGKIQIARYEPTKMVQGRMRNPVLVDETPELSRVFDECAVTHEELVSQWEEKYRIATIEAISQAGIKMPKRPANEASGEFMEYVTFMERYEELVRPGVKLPRTRPVAVEGIDQLLSGIPITEEPYEDRSLMDKSERELIIEMLERGIPYTGLPFTISDNLFFSD